MIFPENIRSRGRDHVDSSVFPHAGAQLDLGDEHHVSVDAGGLALPSGAH